VRRLLSVLGERALWCSKRGSHTGIAPRQEGGGQGSWSGYVPLPLSLPAGFTRQTFVHEHLEQRLVANAFPFRKLAGSI